jgi:hypothetical protein
MAKVCKLCGEPIAAHGDPAETSNGVDRVGRKARTGGRTLPVQRTGRACPLVEVRRVRPDGSEYVAWTPARLAAP